MSVDVGQSADEPVEPVGVDRDVEPVEPGEPGAASDDDALAAREKAVREHVHSVGWNPVPRPAEQLRALAEAAEELGIERHDGYGDGGAVEQLEGELAELLGKPGVVLFPTGTMAQQAALRVWCDRRGSDRVALPDLSHLLHHESDAVRTVLGLRVEHLTTGPRPATAADLRALPVDRGGPLGAALVELPLRDAGCVLPTWEELVELGEAARELGVPLHADGARLYETQPHFGHTLAEVAGCVDSVYVSLYKLLGAMGGAAVAGPAELVDDLRTWRHRMGGRLRHLTPYALGGLVGLRRELPLIPAYVEWTQALARGLVARGIDVRPDPPQTPYLHAFGRGDARASRVAMLEQMEREGHVPCWPWGETQVPGVLRTEVHAHGRALDVDPDEAAELVASLLR